MVVKAIKSIWRPVSRQRDQVHSNKFVHGTKLGGNVDLLEDKESLQRDLDRLEQWAKANGMRLNKAEYQVLPLGYNHPMKCYRLGQSGWKAAWLKRTWGCW